MQILNHNVENNIKIRKILLLRRFYKLVEILIIDLIFHLLLYRMVLSFF